MKKLYLLFFFNILLQNTIAQPKVYTTPKVGDIITTEYANTSGVVAGAIGANQTWDYSNLKDSAFTSTIKIEDASTTTYVKDFPGAQYAGSSGDTLFTYFEKVSGNPAILGNESALIKFKYAHPLVALQYPFTYLDLFKTSDTLYYLTPFTETFKLLDTILICGYGTLKLPGNIYSNVLQARHINSSLGSITEPGGVVINLPLSVDTVFNYYVNGQPTPILTYGIAKGKIYIITYLKSSSLPLHFITFTATPDKEAVQLNWQTGNESNTDVFYIQRSTDGTNFDVIGNVAAIGSGGNNYHYTDELTPSSANLLYYRLQETDKDGASIYTTIVTCKLPDYESVKLYPNPASNNITITGIGKFSSLKIFNLAGQQFMHFTIKDESTTVNVTDLAAGVYIAELSNGNEITRVKFLKK